MNFVDDYYLSFGSQLPSYVLNFIFNGSTAVSLFFILSGLVLSFKYIKSDSPISYSKFIIKRGFRIYPAFWIVLILSFMVDNSFNFQNILQDASLLIATKQELVPPAWSLVIEMQMSVIFLFLIIIARRNIILLFIFVLLLYWLFALTFYAFHFCLGILIAYKMEEIQKIQLAVVYRYLLFFIAWIFCSFNEFYLMLFSENADLGIWLKILELLGCTVWLILVLSAPNFQKKLSIKPLVFLGKISYGLYIGHWLIWTSLVSPYFDFFIKITHSYYLAIIVKFVLTIGLSIIFGYLIYIFIEKPFINLGYKLTKKVRYKLYL